MPPKPPSPPGLEPYDIDTIIATETRLRDQSCGCAARSDAACLQRAIQDTARWINDMNERMLVQTSDTVATSEQWETDLRILRERNRCEMQVHR